MQKLINIELSKGEYDAIKDSFYRGSEGMVKKVGIYADKVFNDTLGHDNCTKEQQGLILENKFWKIYQLFVMKESFPNRYKPIATLSYEKKFVGYRGIWIDCPKWEDAYLFLDNKITCLKMIREKLRMFHELGIVYGDIKDDNILVDGRGEIIFCDLDNMQVGDYSIDIMGTFAQDFVERYGVVDKKLDSYMMNLFTLDQFPHQGWWYPGVISELQLGIYPMEFQKENNYLKNRKLVKEMVNVTEKYQGRYFIDQLK